MEATAAPKKSPQERIVELEKGNTDLCNLVQSLSDEKDRYKLALIDILLSCKGCPIFDRAYRALGDEALEYWKYGDDII